MCHDGSSRPEVQYMPYSSGGIEGIVRPSTMAEVWWPRINLS
jgi:hypothetical protein